MRLTARVREYFSLNSLTFGVLSPQARTSCYRHSSPARTLTDRGTDNDWVMRRKICCGFIYGDKMKYSSNTTISISENEPNWWSNDKPYKWGPFNGAGSYDVMIEK